MKEKDLKEIVKEAVLEALNEFANGGVSTMSDPEVPETEGGGEDNSGNNSGNNGGNNGNGNGNNGGNGGNGTMPPEPVIGPVGLSLR